jgi:hypothetical protein
LVQSPFVRQRVVKSSLRHRLLDLLLLFMNNNHGHSMLPLLLILPLLYLLNQRHLEWMTNQHSLRRAVVLNNKPTHCKEMLPCYRLLKGFFDSRLLLWQGHLH